MWASTSMSSASARERPRAPPRACRPRRPRSAGRRTPGSAARSGAARRERELALRADHRPHARNAPAPRRGRASAPARARPASAARRRGASRRAGRRPCTAPRPAARACPSWRGAGWPTSVSSASAVQVSRSSVLVDERPRRPRSGPPSPSGVRTKRAVMRHRRRAGWRARSSGRRRSGRGCRPSPRGSARASAAALRSSSAVALTIWPGRAEPALEGVLGDERVLHRGGASGRQALDRDDLVARGGVGEQEARVHRAGRRPAPRRRRRRPRRRRASCPSSSRSSRSTASSRRPPGSTTWR